MSFQNDRLRCAVRCRRLFQRIQQLKRKKINKKKKTSTDTLNKKCKVQKVDVERNLFWARLALDMPFLLRKIRSRRRKKENGLGRLQITKSDSWQTLSGKLGGELWEGELWLRRKSARKLLGTFAIFWRREGKSLELSDRRNLFALLEFPALQRNHKKCNKRSNSM